MLAEFRVRNFLSIQDEQVLSLVASGDAENLNSTFETENKKFKLLKSVAIYGANASGKSNLIKAINAMMAIIKTSANTQIETKLPVVPFKLGDESSLPSEFEITFFINQVRHQYGFSATKDKIYSEWLLAYETRTPQTWFERYYDENSGKYTWKLGAKLKGKKELWKESTRENSLFLSTAVQLNSEQLKPIFNNLSKIVICGLTGWLNGESFTAEALFKDREYKKEIMEALKSVDFDIDDIKIKEKKFNPSDLPKDLPQELAYFMKDLTQLNISSFHRKQNNENEGVLFDFSEESAGTRKFFSMIGPLLDILLKGRVVFIDELELSFHPYLTKFIIDLFNNPKTNKNNAQLIFTTHETSALNKEIFRKDQIYFCEKQNKATKLYSLVEFKLRKDAQNWEKSYLGGRFGAVPFLSELEL